MTKGATTLLLNMSSRKQVGFGLGAMLAYRGGATIFATNTLR